MKEKILIFILVLATNILRFLTDIITKTPRILLLFTIIFCLGLLFNQKDKIEELETNLKSSQEMILDLNESLEESQETIDLQRESIQELRDLIESFENRSDKRISFTVNSLIDKYSYEYNLDRSLVECIVSKESGGNPFATSPSGKYVGLTQYSIPTFYSHRRQLGLSEEDLRHDPDANLQAMTSALSRGESSHWPNTYRECTS